LCPALLRPTRRIRVALAFVGLQNIAVPVGNPVGECRVRELSRTSKTPILSPSRGARMTLPSYTRDAAPLKAFVPWPCGVNVTCSVSGSYTAIESFGPIGASTTFPPYAAAAPENTAPEDCAPCGTVENVFVSGSKIPTGVDCL
jgi:hypothetical protein